MNKLFFTKFPTPFLFSPDPAGAGEPEEASSALEDLKLTPEQQRLFDQRIAERLKRQKAAIEAEQKAKEEKVAQEAQEKLLKEQGEFKALADKKEQERLAEKERADKAFAELAELKLKSAYKDTVAKLGYEFSEAKAGEDSFAFLDRSKVGDDGSGMDEAVKVLVQDRPYYFGKAVTQRTDIDATVRGRAKNTPVDELVSRKRSQYGEI